MEADANIQSETDSHTLISLPADLIGEEPDILRQALLAALMHGRATIVEASQVARVGTASLQVLLAFLREAATKGLSVDFRSPSRALADALLCSELSQDPDFERLGPFEADGATSR